VEAGREPDAADADAQGENGGGCRPRAANETTAGHSLPILHALTQLGNTIGRALGPQCLNATIPDHDAAKPGIQATCQVVLHVTDARVAEVMRNGHDFEQVRMSEDGFLITVHGSVHGG
jgi:hypothetical protein